MILSDMYFIFGFEFLVIFPITSSCYLTFLLGGFLFDFHVLAFFYILLFHVSCVFISSLFLVLFFSCLLSIPPPHLLHCLFSPPVWLTSCASPVLLPKCATPVFNYFHPHLSVYVCLDISALSCGPFFVVLFSYLFGFLLSSFCVAKTENSYLALTHASPKEFAYSQ